MGTMMLAIAALLAFGVVAWIIVPSDLDTIDKILVFWNAINLFVVGYVLCWERNNS